MRSYYFHILYETTNIILQLKICVFWLGSLIFLPFGLLIALH